MSHFTHLVVAHILCATLTAGAAAPSEWTGTAGSHRLAFEKTGAVLWNHQSIVEPLNFFFASRSMSVPVVVRTIHLVPVENRQKPNKLNTLSHRASRGMLKLSRRGMLALGATALAGGTAWRLLLPTWRRHQAIRHLNPKFPDDQIRIRLYDAISGANDFKDEIDHLSLPPSSELTRAQIHEAVQRFKHMVLHGPIDYLDPKSRALFAVNSKTGFRVNLASLDLLISMRMDILLHEAVHLADAQVHSTEQAVASATKADQQLRPYFDEARVREGEQELGMRPADDQIILHGAWDWSALAKDPAILRDVLDYLRRSARKEAEAYYIQMGALARRAQVETGSSAPAAFIRQKLMMDAATAGMPVDAMIDEMLTGQRPAPSLTTYAWISHYRFARAYVSGTMTREFQAQTIRQGMLRTPVLHIFLNALGKNQFGASFNIDPQTGAVPDENAFYEWICPLLFPSDLRGSSNSSMPPFNSAILLAA